MSAAEGQDPNLDGRPAAGHAIIAGFGLAGRATANALIAKGVPLYVIERNVDTVRRCAIAGLRIVEGDATDERVLLAAGIQSAVLFAATMPNDHAVLEAVAQARRLNPAVRIFARCEYVSTGMKAARRGADEVVIAEKAVATEFGKLVEAHVPAASGPTAAPDSTAPQPPAPEPASTGGR